MKAHQRAQLAMRLPRIALQFGRPGFLAKRLPNTPLSLHGKHCVITGGNQGIGYAVAEALAARGATLSLLCRNRSKGQQAAETLAVHGTTVDFVHCDIESAASIRSAAMSLEPADVLIHNAGALFNDHELTADGLERTVALHVVGPHLLTKELLPGLRARRGRVVFVSSGGCYTSKLEVAKLGTSDGPQGAHAYAHAKRAQVVLTELWARYETGVSFFAMHPGWVDTQGVQRSLPRFYSITKPLLRSPRQGADTIVWLASMQSPPIASGAFVFDRERAPRHLVDATREDANERERLWKHLEETVGR